MKIIKITIDSVKTVFSVPRIALYLWIMNLIAGAALTIPVAILLSESTQYNLVGDSMLRDFDYLWYTQVFSNNSGFPAFSLNILAAAGLVYMFFYSIFSGGIIAVYLHKIQHITVRQFLGKCIHYAPRMVGLWLISLFVFVLVMYSTYRLSEFMIDSIIANTYSDKTVYYLTYLKLLLLFAVGVFFHLVGDYSKIKAIVNHGKTVFSDYVGAVIFLLKNMKNVLYLFLLISFIAVIFWAAYFYGEGSLNQNTWILIWIVFFIQQIYMLIRILLRLIFYASEIRLYSSLNDI